LKTHFNQNELGVLFATFVHAQGGMEIARRGDKRAFWEAWQQFITREKDRRWPRCPDCGLRECRCPKRKGQVA
jgi:hypothetical protein